MASPKLRPVSILDTFRMTRDAATITAALPQLAASAGDPSTFPIASPWSGSDLSRLVADDVFGPEAGANTRAAAMKIPAVARSRNLMCSTVARFPLVANRGAERIPTPGWMTSSADGSSPQLRIVWTVDDLMFYGWSCWIRENGADGFPGDVSRVPMGDWTVNADGRLEVNGIPVEDPRKVILIPRLHEGILSYGSDVLRDTQALYRIVRQRLENPAPQLDLHQTSGEPLSKPQKDDLLADWAAARKGANGGVAYTSPGLEIRELGKGDAEYMIEARNAASLDIARLIGVSANRIDATSAKASLNYETTTGRNLEFVDFDLALYMTPITARLSLDDVMPHGQSAAFDVADFTAQLPSTTGPTLED